MSKPLDSDELHRLLRKKMDGEVFTQDEAIYIWQEMHQLVVEPDARCLLLLWDELTRELAKGKRCGVCGRYESKDCWEDC